MRLPISYPRGTTRGGHALVVALVAVAFLALLAGAGLTINQSVSRQIVASGNRSRAMYLAEAGVAETVLALVAAEAIDEEKPNGLGSADAPIEKRGGVYWSEVQDNGDGTVTVRSTGSSNRIVRTVEVVLEETGTGLFDNAVFAGNSSGDPAYELNLGGFGGQADLVEGNLYSGGGITIEGDASVTGGLVANGVITGGLGVEGETQPIPDVTSMNYARNNDYDVAALFAGAVWAADDAGGSAWQLPEGNPAHIFRKNPSDRSVENAGTTKEDYYLEDPYTPVTKDQNSDGSDPFIITLAGDSGDHKLFYVDGNLWIHNGPTWSFQFVNENGKPVNVTFVVKGNVTFSDNLFYNDPDNDGVAFIAIEDPAVPDSGNIFFGDPVGGTIEHMDAFMYAENDFVDFHLDKSGSKHVVLNGIMTAGDQVAIERNYVYDDGTTSHSKLEVHFDNRIQLGTIDMPGLPGWKGAQDGGLALVSWREVTSE